MSALVGCSAGQADSQTGDSARASVPATTQACSAGPLERRPLVLPDGTEAYIEPMNLMRVGSKIVVVGSPSYTWELGGTRAHMATDRAHLAAYLDEVPPRLVEMPIDVAPGIAWSVAFENGRWGVLFSEADPEAYSQLSVTVGLWYAEYDGERWSEVESLPMPDDKELFVGTSSSLVDGEGVLRWAVIARGGGAAYHYERRDGAWSFELIEQAGMENAALASGASGVWLALSGVDPDLPVWTKSIRLFRWASGWQLVHRVATVETYTEIRDLFVTILPGGVTVTWREESDAGSAAKATVGIDTARPGTALLIDESAVQAKPVEMPGGPAWVVQHTNGITGISELRLVRAAERGRELLWSLPYPYTGFYAATASGPDEVVVTGSEFDPDPARPTVRSLTLRLSPSCR